MNHFEIAGNRLFTSLEYLFYSGIAYQAAASADYSKSNITFFDKTLHYQCIDKHFKHIAENTNNYKNLMKFESLRKKIFHGKCVGVLVDRGIYGACQLIFTHFLFKSTVQLCLAAKHLYQGYNS